MIKSKSVYNHIESDYLSETRSRQPRLHIIIVLKNCPLYSLKTLHILYIIYFTFTLPLPVSFIKIRFVYRKRMHVKASCELSKFIETRKC